MRHVSLFRSTPVYGIALSFGIYRGEITKLARAKETLDLGANAPKTNRRLHGKDTPHRLTMQRPWQMPPVATGDGLVHFVGD